MRNSLIDPTIKITEKIKELIEENTLLKMKLQSIKESNNLLKLDSYEDISSNSTLNILSTSLSEAGIGLVLTHVTGHIMFVNQAFLQETGYSAEEVIEQHTRVLKSGRHSPEFYEKLWHTVLSGDIWNGQIINKRKDRTIFTEDLTIIPIKNGEGEISFFIAIKKSVEQNKDDQIKNLQRKKTSQILATKILDGLNKPLKNMNYNLCFLKNAFLDIQPKITTNEIKEKNESFVSEQVEINELDIEYLKNEIPAAITQSLKELKNLVDLENNLIEMIRKPDEYKPLTTK